MTDPRRAGQLLPRGDGKFLVRVYLHRDATGKRVYRSQTVYGTVSQARKVLASMQTKADTGSLVKRTKETVGDYLTWWLEHSYKPTVAESTYRGTAERLRLYVVPHIGTQLLDKLSGVTVQSLYSTLKGRKLSDQTVKHAHRALHQALEDAVELGKIATNPCHKRKLPRNDPKKEMKTLSPAQVHLFLESTKGHYLHALWHLLFFAGLRPAEALALRWTDIVEGHARINRTLRHGVNRWYFDEPKTDKSRRSLPLSVDTLGALRDHQRRTGTLGDALLFRRADGTHYPMRNVNYHFDAVLVDLALPQVRLYDTRHTHATLLLEAGENLKVVQERLGHSTIALTANTYSHVTPSMQQGAVLKLDALMRKAAT